MVEKNFKERIGAEFTKYSKEVRPQIAPAFLNWQRNVIDLIEQLENYWLFLSMIADQGVLDGAHRGTLYLASKCSTDISAISACLRNGFPVQSFTLLRSLWETTVTTMYIYQDFDVRIDDFVRYADYLRYKKFQSNPDSVPENRIEKVQENFRDIENRFKFRKDWYYPSMKEAIKSQGLGSKTKPNMHTMAKLVDLDDEYETMYSTLSKVTHGASLIDHLFIKNGRFQGGPNFSRASMISIIGSAIHCGNMAFSTILSHLNTDESLALKRYSDWLYYIYLATYPPQQ